MANALGTLFGAIANAIRAKTGSTYAIAPANFPAEIENIIVNISGGGSGGSGGSASWKFASGTVKNTNKDAALTITHGLGEVPDIICVSPSTVSSGDTTPRVVGLLQFSSAMFEAMGADQKTKSTRGKGFGFVPNLAQMFTLSPSHGVESEDNDALLFGMIRNANDTTFMVGAGSVVKIASDQVEWWAVSGVTKGGGSSSGVNLGKDYVTITFRNGTEDILTRYIYRGDDACDPVATEKIATPTKASDAQYHYTYSGWSLTNGGEASNTVLDKVTSYKTVYAAYTKSLRYYTVTFYDDDGTTVLHTEKVAYGGSCNYRHRKDNHIFNGWSLTNGGDVNHDALNNITGDRAVYGVWEESYAFADASWEYIAELSASGRAADAFAIGDTKTIQITTVDGDKIDSDVQIVGFNHDDLADGTGKAGISIVFVNALMYRIFTKASDAMIFSKDKVYTATGGVREFMNNTVYLSLPEELRTHIKTVSKTTNISTVASNSFAVTNEKVWYPSAAEVTTNYGSCELIKDGELYEYFETVDNRKKYTQNKDGVNTSYRDPSNNNNLTHYGVRSLAHQGVALSAGCIECQSGKLATVYTGYYAIGFCI